MALVNGARWSPPPVPEQVAGASSPPAIGAGAVGQAVRAPAATPRPLPAVPSRGQVALVSGPGHPAAQATGREPSQVLHCAGLAHLRNDGRRCCRLIKSQPFYPARPFHNVQTPDDNRPGCRTARRAGRSQAGRPRHYGDQCTDASREERKVSEGGGFLFTSPPSSASRGACTQKWMLREAGPENAPAAQ